jgi:hypothetical protein
MSTELRGSARDRAVGERARAVSSNQVQDGHLRFATYFVIGLAIIGAGAAIAHFMPLP